METPGIQHAEKGHLTGTALSANRLEKGKTMTAERNPENRFEDGMAVRRSVLGDEHVDRAEAAKTAFDEPFQKLITEGAWGTVWAGDHFTRRERSIVTVALLAALGHEEEVAMHIRAAENTGATPDDIREALLHVAIYAGVPAANRAFKRVKQTYLELGKTFPDQSENA